MLSFTPSTAASRANALLPTSSANKANAYRLNEPTLAPGMIVVRGPEWRYGDEDGGPGSRGIVTKLDFWDGLAGQVSQEIYDSSPVSYIRVRITYVIQGVRVHWLSSGVDNLYRVNDEVRGLEQVIWQSAPGQGIVRGDHVEIEVRPTSMTSPLEALSSSLSRAVANTTDQSKPSTKAKFPGSLKFSSAVGSHAVIPAYSDLDLDNDFTIELWFRLAPEAAKDGRNKCALSIVSGEVMDAAISSGSPIRAEESPIDNSAS